MAIREIPETAIEVQEGLWADLYTSTVLGITRSVYKLYSAEGYCFYLLSNPENYDGRGNLKPAADLTYAQYLVSSYTTVDEINADVVSVPVEEGYEIVSVPNDTVTE